MLTTSPRLPEFVASFEGFRAQMYNDPANHATIGFGHLVHTGPINGSEPAAFKQGLNREQAIALLRDDLKNAEVIVTRFVTVPLRQHQYDALVSFAFNIGRGNFADSDLLTRLNQNEYSAVAGELNRWIFGQGQRLEGLVRRRDREGRLFNKGQYADEFVFTNQDIINAFAKAESALSRETWSLLTKSGLDVFHLAEDRRGPFSDASLETVLGRLSAEERRAVQDNMPDGRDIPPADGYMWLKEVPALLDMPLSPPPAMQITVTADTPALSKRIAKTWNQYGWLLTGISDYYAIDIEWLLAIIAVAPTTRPSGGRMAIQFNLAYLWTLWGSTHPDDWATYFDGNGTVTQWRTAPSEPWQPTSTSQDVQWSQFLIARHLAKEAAFSALQMGVARIPGTAFAHIGYESPTALFNTVSKSDRAQLLGWFDFIAGPYGRERRLHALHDRDILTFAALHYGTDRAADYVARLTEAAAWWKSQPESGQRESPSN